MKSYDGEAVVQVCSSFLPVSESALYSYYSPLSWPLQVAWRLVTLQATSRPTVPHYNYWGLKHLWTEQLLGS